jgi:hypothetical protein
MTVKPGSLPRADEQLGAESDAECEPSVRIEEILPIEFDRSLLVEFSLDLPSVGPGSAPGQFTLAGWAIGTSAPVLSVELVCNGHPFKLVQLQVERPDVLESLEAGEHQQAPDHAQGTRCGFWGEVGSLGLPPRFELQVNAVLLGERVDERIRVPVAHLRGERTTWRPHVVAHRQPLMLTSLGRSGSTWLMRLLAEHPEIATTRQHPYEVRPAVYWMHAMKVLSDPGDHNLSTGPDAFEDVNTSIGPSPYDHPDFVARGEAPVGLAASFGAANLRDLDALCKRRIEGTYAAVEAAEGRGPSRYFVEKMQPTHVQNIFWEIYQQPREIFLVRDLRDVICSGMSFDAKRDTQAFSPSDRSSDEAWLHRMVERGIVRRIVDAFRARSDRALLLRYEDLILEPEATLCAVFAHVGVDAADATVADVLARASVDTDEARAHRTSSDPRSSVGRWRRDLDGGLQTLAAEILGESLEALGYEI